MSEQNTQWIRSVFTEASRTYDLVNHILTLGLDTWWRKKAAGIARRQEGKKWLDVCSGTGDMAGILRSVAGKDTTVVSFDICLPMLKKAAKKNVPGTLVYCAGNSKTLPFADNMFDLVTISFATRNINTSQEVLIEYFREFNRVLKPGGMFVNLETSQPRSPMVKMLFHGYVRCFVKPVGWLISGSKTAYGYLSATIPRFFSADELASIIAQAGFSTVDVTPLTFGIAAVHAGKKG